MNDPGSEASYATGEPTGGIAIPEQGVDQDPSEDVPHGDVRERSDFSRMTQGRRAFSSTPRGCDADRETR